MKRLHLLPLLLMFIALGLPAPSRAQRDAPYIYFYSYLLKGWVIERADGSDSRVIGQGIVGDLNVYENVDWSPSGRWMSWRSARGPVLAVGGAVRMDGTKSVTQLAIPSDEAAKRPTSLVNVAWSPTEDLLLGHNIIGNSPRVMGRLAIIDPETDTIIAQTTVEEPLAEHNGGRSGWLEDGSGVYLTSRGALTILFQTGEIKTVNYSSDIASGAHIDHGYAIGVMRLFDRYAIVIENLTTNRFTSALEIENPYDLRFQIYWSPTETHLLLQKWNCEEPWGCRDSPRTLYLVELTTEKVTFLGGGRDISITGMSGIPLLGNNGDNISQMWSPDGSRAIFLDQYQSEDLKVFGRLRLVDTVTATTTLLPHFDDIYSWQWMGNDALLIRRIDDEMPYRYDLITFEIESLGDFRPEYEWYQLSPSGRYLGGDTYIATNRIVDLQTGETIEWIPHGHPCTHEVDYLWNADESWFFTGQLTYCTDGPWFNFGGMSIHSTDETTNRELTMCSDVGTCAGFLPERAIPHLSAGEAESVLLQPEATLGAAGSNEGIVGWSPDGRILVTTSNTATHTETVELWNATMNFWEMAESPTLIGSAETMVDCHWSCTLQWSSDGQQMEWSGNSVSEVWDVASGRLLRQERRFPPPPPAPYGSWVYDPLVCALALNLRPNPVEPNSTLAWVNDQWVRFSNGGQRCSRDGEWLLVLSDDESGMVLTVLNTQAIHAFDLGERPRFWNPTLDYQPDSPLLIANIYGPNYAIPPELFDIERGEWLTLPINVFARDVALSPDGRWIAAAGAGIVTLWDIADIRAQ